MAAYDEGNSEKHLRDIASRLKISGARIDVAYIEKWADELGLVEIWKAIRQQAGR